MNSPIDTFVHLPAVCAVLLLTLAGLAGCGGGDVAAPADRTMVENEFANPRPDSGSVDSASSAFEAFSLGFAKQELAGESKQMVTVTGLSAKPVQGRPALTPDRASQLDAVRLANQASFGPSEALVRQIRQVGVERWVMGQLQAYPSRYHSGGSDAIHRHVDRNSDFCDTRGPNCWRDWYSSTPLLWDFYRQAVNGHDQLRQRVAFALQQFLVVSNVEVSGTYGLRNYHNMLLERAFGNYRDVLRHVALSPVMGDYLNNVNNDPESPNENFARELLQLFSIGTCELNSNGSLRTGACQATFDNNTVRSYAYALTGWTYPSGGASPWGCWPAGTNCRHYGGNMVAVPSRHNTQALSLLSNVSLGSGHTPTQALDAVLDSLMQHPNIAPFVARHLIQHLVTSNPSPAFIGRVSDAFRAGRFRGVGEGRVGDLKATVAAILLDPEARSEVPSSNAGRLREPVQLFTSVVRLLNGYTDGNEFGWWWGDTMMQHVFRSPSVFNFYSPDYPLSGTQLVGPTFEIHNANTALNRLNFVNYLVFWGGSAADTSVPGATGTRLDLSEFVSSAQDATVLVDRLSLVALGEPLPQSQRATVIDAVQAFTVPASPPAARQDALTNRVRQAAYLVLATPQFQVIR